MLTGGDGHFAAPSGRYQYKLRLRSNMRKGESPGAGRDPARADQSAVGAS